MKRNRKNVFDPHAPLLLDGHSKPINRREFLGRGFLSGSALVTAPGLMSVMGASPKTFAQQMDCQVSQNVGGGIPFICLDLAGGANIAGSNVMVGGPGGQQDAISEEGYRKLGLAPNTADQLDNRMGLLFHSDSAFLRGIINKASDATLANVNGAIFCSRSDNDTGNNPLNPMYGISKAGAGGNLVTLIGTSNSASGGKSRAPEYMIDPSMAPTKIDRPRDATSLVDAGRLGDIFANDNDAPRIMEAIQKLSQMKLDRATEMQAVKQLMSCSYAESAQQIASFGDPASLDPLQDAAINGDIFSSQQLDRSRANIFRKTASVMKLVVDGYAGAGTIEVGGFDYHTGNRSVGEVRDFEAGQAMGAMLEYAARKNQPLMLYVFSDGSVISNGNLDNSQDGRGKGEWTSDRSTTAGGLVLVYNPNGRPTAIRNQVGHYKMDGFLDTNVLPMSNSPSLLSETIVLNYLALSGKQGDFMQLFPQSGIAAMLDEHIAFEPIV